MKIAELKQICARPDVVEVARFACALFASSHSHYFLLIMYIFIHF